MDDTTRELGGEGRSDACTGDHELRYCTVGAMGVFNILITVENSSLGHT